MMVRALEMEDILRLMATDINNDDAYFRIDQGPGSMQDSLTDDGDGHHHGAVYIGPFNIYES